MRKEKENDIFYKRIHEIDFIRGILIVLVFLDHLLNLINSYNTSWAGGNLALINGTGIEPYATFAKIAKTYFTLPFNMYDAASWNYSIRKIVQCICLGTFCFISGISCSFSKSNKKRAFQMMSFWLLILIFSNILDNIYRTNNLDFGIKSCQINFNIIGVLAFSVLTYTVFENKDYKWLIGAIIAILLIHVICAYVSLINPNCPADTFGLFLLQGDKSFGEQADYMPLFPYMAFFFIGALIGKFTYSKNRLSYFKIHEWERPICFVGRHTLIIYFTHFIILIGIFSLLGIFIGK